MRAFSLAAMPRLSRILALSALALLLTLPFLDPRHHLPIATFRQEWLAGGLGLLALLALLADGGGRWQLPRIALLPLAPLALAWLQLALGFDVAYEQAVLLSLYLLWSVILMLAACRLEAVAGRDSIADVIAWSLLAGALLAAAAGAAQTWLPQLGLPWVFPGGGRAIGNVAQANNFADHLWLGLAAAAYLYQRGRLALAPLLAVAAPLLVMSLLSGSRSVYLYAFALAVWCLLEARHGADVRRRRLRHCALLLLPGLLVAQWLIGASGIAGTSVPSAQRLLAEGSYDSVRLTLWRAAADILGDHPLLGAGFDSYSREYFARIEAFPIAGKGIPEHSHNLLTEIAAEFGLLGLAALTAAGAAWLAGLRGRRDDASFLAIAALLVLGIHSLLEYPLWYAHYLAVAALALALGERRRWDFAAGGRQRALFAVGALLGLAALFSLRADYLRLEEATQGGDATGPLGAETRQALLADAYTRSLWRQYAALQFAAVMPIDDHALTERLKLMEEAMRFSPIRQAAFRHAALLQLAGRHDEAAAQLRRAMLAYPGQIAAAHAQLAAASASLPALAPLAGQLAQRSF